MGGWPASSGGLVVFLAPYQRVVPDANCNRVSARAGSFGEPLAGPQDYGLILSVLLTEDMAMCETDSSTDSNPYPDPDPDPAIEFESMSTFKREALLTDYRERRKAIRSHLEITQRQISQGLIAIGFVIGYSL